MADEHFTVVVVGAGPGGSAAARTLAGRGINTCLVDRHSFPRDKLCGGLLTLRSKKVYSTIFDQPWEPIIEASPKGARFFNKRQCIAEIEDYSQLFFAQRFKFDDFLFTQAVKSGACPRTGAAVKEVRAEAGEVALSDGTTLAYDYLIAADGVNSTVARSLYGEAFNQKTIGFALEADIPATEVPDARPFPEIHFGVARWGYGWVFPKAGCFTVGIGGIHSLNPDLRHEFDRFLKNRLGRIPDAKVKGHFLPFGDCRMIPGKGNIILCGDAAGLVDSITGEGIAFALQSGRDAAHAVADAIAAGSRSAMSAYEPKYAAITQHIAKSNFYRWFIFSKFSERLFLKVLPDAGTIQRGYMDLLADERDYGTFPGLLWLQFRKGLRKGLRKFFGTETAASR